MCDIQLRPILVNPRYQQCYPKWPTHNTLLPLGSFAEPYGQVADTLGTALHPQGLIVVERMALALHAGVLDHGACVGL